MTEGGERGVWEGESKVVVVRRAGMQVRVGKERVIVEGW